jgi:hypothetical protein
MLAQGVPSLRDGTRNGEEQLTSQPLYIRHFRMLPIILI